MTASLVHPLSFFFAILADPLITEFPATAEAVDVGSATTAGGYATQESNGRFRGLSNQGATCYLNSLLQSLYMTPEFRAGLYEWTYDEAKDGPKEDCIPYQLQSLFGRMQLRYGVVLTSSQAELCMLACVVWA